MNTKLVKRMLAATLAATLMVAPIITAGATTSEPFVHDDTVSQETAAVEATSTVNVGGTVIKTLLNGSYNLKGAKTIAGVAIRQTAPTIKANLGLAANETPFVRVYLITAKKSPAAFASFNGAAASVGATVLEAVNVDFGKMTGGRFSNLPADASVPATIGVKNANGRTLAVVKVLPGGATEILADQDDNPNTVTFNITGGLAAYAVIAY